MNEKSLRSTYLVKDCHEKHTELSKFNCKQMKTPHTIQLEKKRLERYEGSSLRRPFMSIPREGGQHPLSTGECKLKQQQDSSPHPQLDGGITQSW